jgi:predicted MFS family arabinose efflux permease
MLGSGYGDALRHRGFRRLMIGTGVSCLGDVMSAIAIAWLAISLAPAGREGLVTGAALAAYSLPGFFGAIALDRPLRRVGARKLVMANAALRGLLLGTAAVAAIAGALTPVVFVALLACSSILSAWGNAGIFTLIGELIPPDGRLAANSLNNTILNAAVVAGPPLAGVVVAGTSAGVALAIDALTWVVLALQVARVPVPEDAPAVQPARHGGMRLLVRRPQLFGLAVVSAVFFFLYGPVEVSLPVLVSDSGLSAGVLGAYWTVFGMGAVVGGLLGGLLRLRSPWPLVVAVIAGWGLLLVPFGFPVPVAVTVAAFGIGGLIWAPYPAFVATVYQNSTPPGELASVLAAKQAIVAPGTPMGMIAGGALIAAMGPQRTILVSGLATMGLALVTGLVLLVKPLVVGEARDHREHDHEQDDPDEAGAAFDGHPRSDLRSGDVADGEDGAEEPVDVAGEAEDDQGAEVRAYVD